MTTVTQLYRHPLKSHGREELDHTAPSTGQSMPWNQTWAVAHGAARLDETEWAHCANLSTGSKAPFGLMPQHHEAILIESGTTCHLAKLSYAYGTAPSGAKLPPRIYTKASATSTCCAY